MLLKTLLHFFTKFYVVFINIILTLFLQLIYNPLSKREKREKNQNDQSLCNLKI